MSRRAQSVYSFSSQPYVRRRAGSLLSLTGALLLLGGCTQELPPRTTLELMDQPAVLEAVITRCEDLGEDAAKDPECLNAREAVDRIAAREAREKSEAQAAAARAEFERQREERRLREERERQLREAQEKVDPYTLPLIEESPPEATSAKTPPAPNSSDPAIG